MSPALKSAVFVAGACALVFCSPPKPSGETTTTVDSAGVRIVTTRPGPEPRLADIVVDSVPTLTIGAGSNDPRYQLGWITGARQLASGDIAIADARLHSIRIYNRSGTFLRDVGRRGQGPGEFEFLGHLQSRGDTLIACCGPGVVRTMSSGTFLSRSAGITRSLVGALPDGSDIQLHRQRAYVDDDTKRQLLVMALADSFFHVSADGRTREPMGSWVQRTLYLNDPSPNPALGYNQTPIASAFVAEARYAVTDRGLAYAAGEELRVDLYNPAGKWTESFRLARPPTPVTPAMMRHYTDASLKRYKKPEQVEMMRWIIDAMPAPGSLPQVEELVVANDGGIWLGERVYPREPTQIWHIFAPDGSYGGIVRTPQALELRQIGSDFVLATGTSSDGEPVLHRFALAPR